MDEFLIGITCIFYAFGLLFFYKIFDYFDMFDE